MTNPTAYKRLQTEVDELGDNIVDYAKQVNLPYLNAVLWVILIEYPGFLFFLKNLVVKKASDYSPLCCRVYSVLWKRELEEEWPVRCGFPSNSCIQDHF